MIGELYAMSVAGEAHAATLTLMELASASDAVTTIERIYITQTSFDTSENLGSTTQRISSSGTGSPATYKKFGPNQIAFGGTGKTNFTIEPTYAADTQILELGFNVLSGLLWTPANDDEVIVIAPSGLVGTNLDVTPSSSMNFNYGMTFREIG